MILNNKYRIEEEIGRGEFGAIYRATNIRTGKEVAIKREPISEYTLLQREAKVYQYIKDTKGFPQVYWFGVVNSYYYMALTLLGNSLKREVELNGPFSLEKIEIVGEQMVKRLETLHSKGLIHRDIKPDNFVFGRDTDDLYLIDFGFCKKYEDEDENKMVKSKGGSIIGTPNYVSIRVEQGCEPGRRDDMESVAYVLYYLWKGIPLEMGQKEKGIKSLEVPEYIRRKYKGYI